MDPLQLLTALGAGLGALLGLTWKIVRLLSAAQTKRAEIAAEAQRRHTDEMVAAQQRYTTAVVELAKSHSELCEKIEAIDDKLSDMVSARTVYKPRRDE